ncbi:MAG TPA: ATP-binding protein [Opitutaceae bacterium]|nr:ATP-binding protein [Opitutaceae bacterium]
MTASNAMSGDERLAAAKREQWLTGQNVVLEMIASGAPLEKSLDALVRLIESQAPDMFCTILIVDEEGTHLRHGAAPRMTESFVRAIDGRAIGPVAGSCGTAVYRRAQVVVTNIETDPLWADYRDIALVDGLRACWSTPIFDPDQHVLGTFAMYYKHVAGPTEEHQRLIELATHIAAIAISRVHTEAKAELSRQRLALATDAAHIGIWDWDLKNDRFFPTPTYEKIWGRTCNPRWLSSGEWLSTIHENDRDRVDRAARGRDQTGRFDAIYRILRPDASIRWIHDQAYPIINDAGAITRLLGTAVDFTEQREAEEAKEQLERELRQTQKMEALGTLAGGIAHDFNNLLGAILGYADLTKFAAGKNSEIIEYMDEVRLASARASKLVQQILTFSRQSESKREVIKIGPIVSEALNFLRATIPTTVRIESNLPADAWSIVADPINIHQVMMNLATNAAHAMKERGGRLEVTLSNVRSDGRWADPRIHLPAGPYVRLAVADTGRGMDEATMARIFDPFFTTKNVGEGTGMGLAVVHGIIQSLGGMITVDSRVGHGTTFAIHIPATMANPTPAVDPTAEVRRGNGERILVVDDEPLIATMTARSLEHLGYAVTSFNDPVDALAAVQSDPKKFDLVVTDLTMPMMRGTELAEKILKIRPDVPILLITGYSATLSAESARNVGIREMLFKPLTLQTLSEVVHRSLES